MNEYKYIETGKVTRVEVIDENGRAFVRWEKHLKVQVQLQDNERTLKIFVSNVNR